MQETRDFEVEYNNFKGYQGNSNLKREGVQVNWTSEMVEEYTKCAADPIYFIETYMKIIHVDRGLIPFKMYDYQQDMIRMMSDSRRTVLTLSRQSGKSISTCGFILHYIIFNSEKTVGLLANKGSTAREILGKIQLAYQHLPKWLQQGVKEWNKGTFVLENNSRVLAAATSSDNIRGYSLSLLFIDESAFVENWDEFFSAVYPTISSGETTKIILVSTPNGLNHFYSTYDNAVQGLNGYSHMLVTWDKVPGRDEAWRQDTLAAMNFDQERFDREYNCIFAGSSGTLISGNALQRLHQQIPLYTNDGLTTYCNPVPDNKYTMVADVARGKGLDYSAFQIIDVTSMPYQQVCTYRNNLISPGDFASVIFRVATLYNEASVLVEVNDIGGQVADMLYDDFEYENLLFTESGGRNGKRVSSGFGNNVDRGLKTSKSSKAIGCSILKLLIEQNQLILNDFETISELSTFSRKANSYEAESGKHDDLVMCLVLFSWLTEDKYFKEFTDINTLIRLREKTDDDIMNELTPFGFMDDGRGEPDEDVIDPNDSMRRSWSLI